MITSWIRKRREARTTARRAAWLEREKDWWDFMLTMDLAHGKVTAEEARIWWERIARGEEYKGWALGNHE